MTTPQPSPNLSIRLTEDQLGFLAYLYPNDDPEEALVKMLERERTRAARRADLRVQALQLARQECEDAPIEQAVVQMPGERVGSINPIGALQELCQSQHRNLPVYEFEVLASGFRCTVTALGLTAVGEGPAKKMAKTEAAKRLVKRVAEGE